MLKNELTASQLEPCQIDSGINVVARIRPALPGEPSQMQACIYKVDEQILETCDPQNRQLKTQHSFDHVFGPEADNCDVAQSLRKGLEGVVRGIPLLQINYGVTSSGKTFTLFGTMQQPGILAFSADVLRELLPNCRLYMSAVQIYLNVVTDLLNPGTQLKAYATQQDPLPNRTFVDVTQRDQFDKMLRMALKAREQAATNSNAQSSRSHCLIFLQIEKDGEQNQCCFVDLAGSEPFQAGQSKSTQQESSFIRTSLLMLDKAIRDLRNLTTCNQNSVSFRSSQLTMCLRTFLQPRQVAPGRFELPGTISLVLNLHGNPQGFYANKETLGLGLLTKEIKNYAKTPSRLGQLGHSVASVARSVKSSLGVEDSTQGEEIIGINKDDWQGVQDYFLSLADQIEELQRQMEQEILDARKDAVDEMKEIMELELQAQADLYEIELAEKDAQILELKRQLANQ